MTGKEFYKLNNLVESIQKEALSLKRDSEKPGNESTKACFEGRSRAFRDCAMDLKNLLAEMNQ